MKPKKNPKSDFSKKSILFFQIGLILVLFISWQAVEWKTYGTQPMEKTVVSIDQLAQEDVPITKIVPVENEPATRVQEIPEVIDEIDEVEDTETEDIFEPIEHTPVDPVEVTDIVEAKTPEEEVKVPFHLIENAPVFPGCEGQDTNEGRKQCMSEKIQEFVNKKFDRSVGEAHGLRGVNKIYLSFKINEKGEVVEISSRGPHPQLEKEAERVVDLLPQMEPGQQGKKPVSVLYSLPIIFQVKN